MLLTSQLLYGIVELVGRHHHQCTQGKATCTWFQRDSVTDQDGQQSRHDPGGARGKGAGGVLHRAPQGPHGLRQEQHPSLDQLPVVTFRE